MRPVIRQLHGALFDLAGFMSQPQRDAALSREAGVSLDRALFALLVAVDRRGPIGVVDLAGQVGRDHTTVSRQVAVLERDKLVTRKPSPADRRSRVASITPEAGRSSAPWTAPANGWRPARWRTGATATSPTSPA